MKNNKSSRTKTMRKKTKQKNRFYTVVVIAIITFFIGTAIFLSLPNVTNQSDNTKTSNSANDIKLKALKLISSDSKTAKVLFQQALAMYQSSKDTNNIVDTESLIYFIDHKK